MSTQIRAIKSVPIAKIIATLLTVFMMVLIASKPDIYLKSAQDGLLLFAISVLPAVFPFFFFTAILTALGAPKLVAKASKSTVSFLFNAPAISAYIFLMSLLSGYPAGAKLISDLYEDGMLTKEEAKKCSSFCSTTNPVFVLGTVGSVMLKNFTVALFILISHYLSAILCGVLLRGRKKAKDEVFILNLAIDHNNILADAALSASYAMFIVGGFICVFNVLLDALANLKILSFLSSIFSFIGGETVAMAIFSGAIEMTRGCFFVSTLSIDNAIKGALCALIVSFGGLSVLCQSATFLAKCKIKVTRLLSQKLLHALLAFLLCFALCLVFL